MSKAWKQFLTLILGGKNDTPVQSGHYEGANQNVGNQGTSDAWQYFLKHYNADPREKDNGQYHFEGMSPDELLKAEKLLVEKAKQFEIEEIYALRHLKTPGAQRCIEKLFKSAYRWEKLQSPEVFITVCSSGWVQTQEPRYQQPIYEALHSKDYRKLDCALANISHYLPVTPEIYQQLKTLLLGDPDFMVLSTLAQTTMKYFGLGTVWGHGYQENEPIIRALSDRDPKIRASKLAELEQKYGKR